MGCWEIRVQQKMQYLQLSKLLDDMTISDQWHVRAFELLKTLQANESEEDPWDMDNLFELLCLEMTVEQQALAAKVRRQEIELSHRIRANEKLRKAEEERLKRHRAEQERRKCWDRVARWQNMRNAREIRNARIDERKKEKIPSSSKDGPWRIFENPQAVTDWEAVVAGGYQDEAVSQYKRKWLDPLGYTEADIIECGRAELNAQRSQLGYSAATVTTQSVHTIGSGAWNDAWTGYVPNADDWALFYFTCCVIGVSIMYSHIKDCAGCFLHS